MTHICVRDWKKLSLKKAVVISCQKTWKKLALKKSCSKIIFPFPSVQPLSLHPVHPCLLRSPISADAMPLLQHFLLIAMAICYDSKKEKTYFFKSLLIEDRRRRYRKIPCCTLFHWSYFRGGNCWHHKMIKHILPWWDLTASHSTKFYAYLVQCFRAILLLMNLGWLLNLNTFMGKREQFFRKIVWDWF